MKKVNIIGAVFILVMFLSNTSCRKEPVCDTCSKTNKPPVAVAGADQVITLPLNSAILNGQASSDPDGSIRHWRWNKIAGPLSSTLQQPDSSRTIVTDLSAGIYQYELTVTDDQGLAAKDTVRVFVDVVSTQNHPPIAVAGADQTIILPTNTITLDGSASYDLENNINGQLWTKISGPIAGSITNANMLQTTVTQVVAGVYGFELKISDSGGLEGRDTVFITVQASVNRAPDADAGPDQNLLLNNSTTLNGSGSSDPDNNITIYLWTRVSGPGSFIIQQPANVQTIVEQLSAGIHKFELKVTDAGGLTDRDTMQVTVSPATNQPPQANAGADQVITLPVNMAHLNGQNSTDPENNITQYAWKQVAGPAPSYIPYPGNASVLASDLIQGIYVFELTVTDVGGLSGNDSVKVTVAAVPTGNSAVFDNLFWFGSCYLIVPNIYSFVPPGSNLNVELKRYDYQGQPSAWMPVRIQGSQLPGDWAYYAIENGNLNVYSIGIDCNFDDAQSYSIRVTY